MSIKRLIAILMFLMARGLPASAGNVGSSAGVSCTPSYVLDDQLNCRNSTEPIVIVIEGKKVEISTSGFTGSDGPVIFSSNVVIVGDLRVNSTKSKAVYIPTGGIHLDDGLNEAAVAPGQMFAKKVRTSTITLVGSAMLFQNAAGVITSTMTGTSLETGAVTSSSITASGSITATEVSGKIRTTAGGAGAPADSDCDASGEQGLMYLGTSPGRLYICDFNGASGWRYSTLSP